LFDGIPRTLNQARQLDELLHRRDVALSHVIALDVPREELEQRLLKRARVEGRADDTPETINNRMEVYDRQTAPLLDFYRSQGLLRCINAVGTPEGVFRKIQPFLES
jgi:adenylate kinase